MKFSRRRSTVSSRRKTQSFDFGRRAQIRSVMVDDLEMVGSWSARLKNWKLKF